MSNFVFIVPSGANLYNRATTVTASLNNKEAPSHEPKDKTGGTLDKAVSR